MDMRIVQAGLSGRKLKGLRMAILNHSDDEETATKLAEFLKLVGVSTWRRSDMLAGQVIHLAAREELRKAHFVLVLCSRSSMQKTGEFQVTLKAALQLADEMPEGGIRIIPIRIEEVSLQSSLDHLWQVDIWDHDAWERLISSFEKELSRRRQAHDM